MAHFLVLIISILVSLTTATAQESDQLYKICSDDSQTLTNPTVDVKNLLDDIYAKAPQNHGFWKANKGQAYALGLCRGDVSADYCDFCLYDARCKITQRCNKTNAIVWYDYCSLKYSDYNFFGEIDTKNEIGLYNVDNATDAKGFNATARSLLGDLSTQATRNDKLFSFGTRFAKKENTTIYGMAQCSMDLNKKSCTTCLARAVEVLPGFTSNTSPVGARTLFGSCNVRYETYPFLNVATTKKSLIVTTQIYN